MSRAASPSGGMLKKMFNPANVKKKEKTALGMAKSGGPNIQNYPGSKQGRKK
jgi:hypothetical protein